MINVLLALVLAALTVWGTLAIHFGDSAVNPWRSVLADAFGTAGLAATFAAFSPRWRRRVVSVYAVLFIAVLGWWFGIAPSNDRAWQPEVERLPHATVEGDLVTVHDVRNFTYRTESDFTPAYYTRTYDLRKLDSVDLYFIYWMGPAIAHTIVSFGFGDQGHLAVSIEARKERGEGYSSIRGFFRQYELIYIVADERDVIRLRTDYRKDPPEDVYLFRVKGTPEAARRFFLAYMNAMNALRERPQFYNTLTANCTNLIWIHSGVNLGQVPFSWRILASGYAPEYLYNEGRLDTRLPFPELMERAHINRLARAADGAPDFSRRIREGLTDVPSSSP